MGENPEGDFGLQKKKCFLTAVVLAAGEGRRMNSPVKKQNMEILGESVLSRAISAFDSHESVDAVVAVVRREDAPELRETLSRRFKKLVAVVDGGECRQESARLGFLACPDATEYVAIHDAARCLVTPSMIDAVFSAALEHGAASAGRMATDTVKRVTPEGRITETLDRASLFLAATPQIFERSIYNRALIHSADSLHELTDDNMLVERIGVSVAAVDTGAENIKITTAEDIALAEYVLKRR